MRVDDMFGYDDFDDGMESQVAELMGYEYDSMDFYGKSLIKRIISRIKRARRRRAKRAKKRGNGDDAYSIRTPAGSVKYSDAGGLSFLKPSKGSKGNVHDYAQQRPGIMQMVQDNPLLLAIPAGALFLIAMQRRPLPKRRKR